MKKTSFFNISPILRFGGQGWFFPVLTAWVLFVFGFFFFKLYFNYFYYGWTNAFHNFNSSTYSWGPVDLSHRLTVWKDSFLDLSTGFLVMGILWTCGKRLFRWFSLEAPQTVRFCLEIGLGVFLINLFWMGFGLTRLWMEPLWLVGFVLSTFLFLKDFLELYRKGFSLVRPNGLSFWLAAICVFYFVFLLLHSVLPETFYDSLNYFLGMPSFWLWHHGICDYPTHLLSGYFHGGSLFFLNGFVLGGTEGAKVLAALVLLWIALACYGWGKELGGLKAGEVAATAVLTFPLLYLNSWAVRVDGLLTFVLLLFFYAIEKGVSSKKGGMNWLVVAGIFAGLALSIKPTAIVAIGAALIALIWRDRFAVFKKKGWIVFMGILALEVGPWFLKNACFAGNPFFPYAVSWMGGRSFSAWSQERLLHENQQFLPMDHGLSSVLTLPWRLTIPGAGDDQFIGPLLLAFLPLFFFLRFKNSSLKFLVRTLLLSFLLGLTLSHMLRFSIPAFVLSFLVLSTALTLLKDGRWKFLWTSAIVVSAFLCLGQYFSISATWYDGWGIWSGHENQNHYLGRKIASSYMYPRVDKNLPKDARLLVVGDAQVLYYQRPAYANSVFDDQFFAVAARKEKDAAGILLRLKKLGITHVIIYDNLGAIQAKEYHQYELNENQWRKIDTFVQRGLEFLSGGDAALYRVREKLLEKSPHPWLDPFHLYPPQAHDYANDFCNKNYRKAKVELEQLLNFFPGDNHWLDEKHWLAEAEKYEFMKKGK